MNNELFSYKEKATKYDILTKKYSEAKSQLDSANNALQDSKDANEELQARINAINEELESLRNTASDHEMLKSRYASLESDKESLERQLKEEQDKATSLQGTIDSLTHSCSELRKQLASKEVIETRLGEVTKQYEDAKASVAELKQKLEEMNELRTKIEEYRVELETAESKKKSLEAKIAELTESLSTSEETSKELEKQVNDLNGSLIDKKLELKSSESS